MTGAFLALLALAGPLPTVDVAIVGDVQLGRGIARRFPTGDVFGAVRSHLRLPDLTFGNLECALTRRQFVLQKRHLLRADPAVAKSLADAGFDALNLANNHTQDAGPKGLADTVSALNGAQIQAVGTLANPASRFIVRGLRVSVVGGADVPTVPYGPTEVAERAALLAAVARERTKTDVLIVLVHWGVELLPSPDPRVVSFGRDLVRRGADLVAGSGPHVVWPDRWVSAGSRNGYVAYSLGNFVFDAPAGPTRQGTILRARLTRQGVTQVDLLPVRLVRGAPVPVIEQRRGSP